MNDSDIYAKTAAGAEELKSRSHALAPRLRTMLIMVDGSRNVAQLNAAAAGLGAPGDFLHLLESRGLIAIQATHVNLQQTIAEAQPEPPPAARQPAAVEMPGTALERYQAARKLMNTAVVDALGLRGFFFTLKLEKCAAAADLRALLPEFTQSLTKARGDLFARRVADQVRALLD